MRSICQYVGLWLTMSILSACTPPNTKESSVVKDSQKITSAKGMFSNPLFSNGADPWLEFFNGNYYLTTTTWTSQLVMRKSPTLDGLATAEPVNIWSDNTPSRCCSFWAFEFHRLKGPNGWRWYLMYTSGQHGTLDHQHLSVLESAGDDPMGPYTHKSELMPNTWNIDGTYLEHKGQLYLLWSEWQGDSQLNWITRMPNPWSIEGPRVVLTRPTADWEKSGRKVNEGAEILKRNGRTFLIYSASFCDTPDYKLAMKELTGDDPMNPDHWTKYPEPVFQRGNGVYGPGHNGFFKSPDGTEDWIVYHGNNSPGHGCGSTRSVRAQKFVWNDDGTPNFGEPVPEGEQLKLPSGEDGPLSTPLEGALFHFKNNVSNRCAQVRDDRVVQGDCANKNSEWIIDETTDGLFRFNNLNTGLFLGDGTAANYKDALKVAPWQNNLYQKWKVTYEDDGQITIANAKTGFRLGVDGCVPEGDIVYRDENSLCALFRFEPAKKTAIASVQSGRLITACDGNVEQNAWAGKDCHSWRFSHTDGAFFQLKQNGQCMRVKGDQVVPGANIELGNCDGWSAQWRFDFTPKGSVKIKNRHSNLFLDLANCGLADGINIGQSFSQDNDCQKFRFREIF